jgi:hypothetical protein
VQGGAVARAAQVLQQEVSDSTRFEGAGGLQVFEFEVDLAVEQLVRGRSWEGGIMHTSLHVWRGWLSELGACGARGGGGCRLGRMRLSLFRWSEINVGSGLEGVGNVGGVTR